MDDGAVMSSGHESRRMGSVASTLDFLHPGFASLLHGFACTGSRPPICGQAHGWR